MYAAHGVSVHTVTHVLTCGVSMYFYTCEESDCYMCADTWNQCTNPVTHVLTCGESVQLFARMAISQDPAEVFSETLNALHCPSEALDTGPLGPVQRSWGSCTSFTHRHSLSAGG